VSPYYNKTGRRGWNLGTTGALPNPSSGVGTR
jgi:hypothetical protein